MPKAATAAELQALRREHGALRGKVESLERFMLEQAHRGSSTTPVVNVTASAPIVCPVCKGKGRPTSRGLTCQPCGGTGVAKLPPQEILVRVQG